MGNSLTALCCFQPCRSKRIHNIQFVALQPKQQFHQGERALNAKQENLVSNLEHNGETEIKKQQNEESYKKENNKTQLQNVQTKNIQLTNSSISRKTQPKSKQVVIIQLKSTQFDTKSNKFNYQCTLNEKLYFQDNGIPPAPPARNQIPPPIPIRKESLLLSKENNSTSKCTLCTRKSEIEQISRAGIVKRTIQMLEAGKRSCLSESASIMLISEAKNSLSSNICISLAKNKQPLHTLLQKSAKLKEDITACFDMNSLCTPIINSNSQIRQKASWQASVAICEALYQELCTISSTVREIFISTSRTLFEVTRNKSFTEEFQPATSKVCVF
jgi:hypothetical protein